MQESDQYEYVFIGNRIKGGGMFILRENEDTYDIKIETSRWYRIRPNTIFVTFMNICVLLSSLMLAFEDPLGDPNSVEKRVLMGFDIFFTLIFVLEAIIKILALGFYRTSLRGKRYKAYIKDPWNILDFFLVFVQLIDLFKQFLIPGEMAQSFVQSFKALKAMRALRPLRMISRFKGLRIAMNTVVNSGQ